MKAENELLQHCLRRHAYIVHVSLVEKPLSQEELWPIAGEEKETPEERIARIKKEDAEIIARIMEREGLTQKAAGNV